MGKHFIMIGATGTFTSEQHTALVAAVCGLGLQVRHASSRYDGDGQTRFAVGTPDDLQQDLNALGFAVECVPVDGATTKAATDSAVDAEVLGRIDGTTATLLKEFRAFVKYEKKNDQAKLLPVSAKKEAEAGGEAAGLKEGGGDDKEKDADLQLQQDSQGTGSTGTGGAEKASVNAKGETPATPLG